MIHIMRIVTIWKLSPKTKKYRLSTNN